jgi:hypothetical protein
MANIKCPNCAREFVRRVSRAGFAEPVLSLFYIYPFQCQLCGFRFRFFQWGIRSIRVEEDRRVYDRLKISCPVAFTGENCAGEGRLIEVSMGGCNFSTAMPLTAGAVLRMVLEVSKDVEPIVIDATVVRCVRPENIGVEFIHCQAGERERLQQFVRGLLIDQHK